MSKIHIRKTINQSERRAAKPERSKRRERRRISKSELRYRIVENTMRGYFNYSI